MERVKNRNRYQEEEIDGESDGVCKKDEKDTRGGRSSIEESTREDGMTGRQRKKRDKSMESGG